MEFVLKEKHVNPAQKTLLISAIKSGVSAACGVIIANLADSTLAPFTVPWLKHVAIATGVVILVCEARFFKQWADSGTNP